MTGLRERYRNLPIRKKLQLSSIVTIAIGLFAACLAILAFAYLLFVRSEQNDLGALAAIVGSNSTAALSFHDQEAAGELLNGLAAKPTVTAAILYTAEGRVLASYGPRPEAFEDRPPADWGGWLSGHRLRTHLRILLGSQPVGSIYIESN
ncbi:MAG TPA: CHASE sensor domain-containing protein, partial [Bryobacteraceae bacterium]|nr:CHASE sensor domain-containing protein [Bryobacteraceae bacterium]